MINTRGSDKKLHIFALTLISMFILFFLSGCGRENTPASKTDFVMDTVASVTIYDEMPEEVSMGILNDCFREIRRLEGLFSTEIPGSDVDRINSSSGEPVEVSEETIDLIETALYYSELTNGAFDITIRPVSKLWDFRSGTDEVPDDRDIKEALKHVGYKNVILNRDSSTVTLPDPEAEIDLGAIAKGYTGDRVKELLIEKGVRSAIINLGGNVVILGSKPDGSPFKVGIEKPFDENGEMIRTIEVKDASVVTSGNYERYFYKDGRLYHHILDTSTGYPVDSGLNAVTVVSEQSVDGDSLSTSLFCLGQDEGDDLLQKLDKEVTVYYTDKNNEIIK